MRILQLNYALNNAWEYNLSIIRCTTLPSIRRCTRSKDMANASTFNCCRFSVNRNCLKGTTIFYKCKHSGELAIPDGKETAQLLTPAQGSKVVFVRSCTINFLSYNSISVRWFCIWITHTQKKELLQNRTIVFTALWKLNCRSKLQYIFPRKMVRKHSPCLDECFWPLIGAVRVMFSISLAPPWNWN